eukprot:3116079-Pleurochrysis_carterae.AAC.1
MACPPPKPRPAQSNTFRLVLPCKSNRTSIGRGELCKTCTLDNPPAAKTYVNAFSAEMSPARGGRLRSGETDTDEMMHKPSHRSAEITGACKSTSSASTTGLCVDPSSSCQRSNGLFLGQVSINPDEVARVLLLVDVAG